MYCRGADTPEYWEDHWKQHPPQMMTGMGVYVGFRWAIERYMPREGLIVEAGCGNGNTARTIRAAGYDIECLDFAPEVIAANLAIDPGGCYRVGDVREMPYASGTLTGYISLGVVKHFDDVTRRQILREAARCLMPGATETDFFERADMMDTKVGTDKKDDPADVAKTGFNAMMDGKGDVVSGWYNKLQSAIATVTPSGVLAQQHRKMAAPGTAKN